MDHFEEYVEFAILWEIEHGVHGTCLRATQEMIRQFPELRRVCGHVVMLAAPDGDKKPWPHWWCVDLEGNIVDPTRDQFPGPIEYYEMDPDSPVTGRCLCCGGLCYDYKTFCSDTCTLKFKLEISGDTR